MIDRDKRSSLFDLFVCDEEKKVLQRWLQDDINDNEPKFDQEVNLQVTSYKLHVTNYN